MGQSIAGELSGCDLGLQSGLHRREVVDIAEHAAIAPAAFLHDVLPETADERARRIVEGGAEIGERRRRRRWRRRRTRRIWRDRRIGRDDGRRRRIWIVWN